MLEGEWGLTPIGGVGAARDGCMELCLEDEPGVTGIVSEVDRPSKTSELFGQNNYFLRLLLSDFLLLQDFD